MTSDHSPVLLTISSRTPKKNKSVLLTNKCTDWGLYRDYISSNINLGVRLKNIREIESVAENSLKILQKAAKIATSTSKPTVSNKLLYPEAVR